MVPPYGQGAGHRLSDRGTPTSVDLYWIPLGADTHVVRLSGAIFEAGAAAVARRPRQPLFHAALVVTTDAPHTIEMTPIPATGAAADRGVVASGPVGLRALGRFRVFRYEIRRWRHGVIPDLAHAVASPVRLTRDPAVARRVLDLVPSVPTPAWGRDELGAGDMWNSNSVVAWLLTGAGILAAAGAPPRNGRAPGWSAGVVVSHRSGGVVHRGAARRGMIRRGTV